MDEEARTLLAMLLPGLEMMKTTLDGQIGIIRQYLKAPATVDAMRLTAEGDPTILGIDTLGRIIRKRNFSEETLEKKRLLMAKVRQDRLKEIEELRKFKQEHTPEAAKGKRK